MMSDKMKANLKHVQNALLEQRKLDSETRDQLKRIEEKLDELLKNK